MLFGEMFFLSGHIYCGKNCFISLGKSKEEKFF